MHIFWLIPSKIKATTIYNQYFFFQLRKSVVFSFLNILFHTVYETNIRVTHFLWIFSKSSTVDGATGWYIFSCEFQNTNKITFLLNLTKVHISFSVIYERSKYYVIKNEKKIPHFRLLKFSNVQKPKHFFFFHCILKELEDILIL